MEDISVVTAVSIVGFETICAISQKIILKVFAFMLIVVSPRRSSKGDPGDTHAQKTKSK